MQVKVAFPNLGISEFILDPVAFSLFGLEVRWYGLVIVTGMIAAFFYARFRAYMEGIDVESEVYCPVNKEDEFNQKVKYALLPLINEYVSFHMDMKGTFLELKYNVKYRVYLIGDTEYTEIPEKFKNL